TQVIQTPEQHKYLTKLLGYDYSIEYKAGKENVVADALSRQHEFSYLAFSMPHFTFVDKLKQEYTTLPAFVQLIAELVAGSPLKWNLRWFNDLLFKDHQLFLVSTSSLIPLILEEFHSIPTAGHFGVKKTYQRILAQFYWPGVKRDVELFVRGCLTCQ